MERAASKLIPCVIGSVSRGRRGGGLSPSSTPPSPAPPSPGMENIQCEVSLFEVFDLGCLHRLGSTRLGSARLVTGLGCVLRKEEGAAVCLFAYGRLELCHLHNYRQRAANKQPAVTERWPLFFSSSSSSPSSLIIIDNNNNNSFYSYVRNEAILI